MDKQRGLFAPGTTDSTVDHQWPSICRTSGKAVWWWYCGSGSVLLSSLNTVVRKKYRNDKWHIECSYTSHSDCYEDIISPNLSGERKKKGKVVANCHVFDWHGCVMNRLAQVPRFVKCSRQEMIACVVTRNSDDETQIFNTDKNIACFFLSSATRAQVEQDVSPAACSNITSASTATLGAQHPSVTTHRLLWSPLKKKENLFSRPDQLKGIFHSQKKKNYHKNYRIFVMLFHSGYWKAKF